MCKDLKFSNFSVNLGNFELVTHIVILLLYLDSASHKILKHVRQEYFDAIELTKKLILSPFRGDTLPIFDLNPHIASLNTNARLHSLVRNIIGTILDCILIHLLLGVYKIGCMLLSHACDGFFTFTHHILQ